MGVLDVVSKISYEDILNLFLKKHKFILSFLVQVIFICT